MAANPQLESQKLPWRQTVASGATSGGNTPHRHGGCRLKRVNRQDAKSAKRTGFLLFETDERVRRLRRAGTVRCHAARTLNSRRGDLGVLAVFSLARCDQSLRMRVRRHCASAGGSANPKLLVFSRSPDLFVKNLGRARWPGFATEASASQAAMRQPHA